MQFDLSQDYRYWDSIIPGGVTLVSNATARDSVSVVDVAKKRPVNKKELAASNGVYRGDDQVFLLPAALVTGGDPQPRDEVKVGDTTYTVLEATGRRHDSNGVPQTWVLVTRNLIIAHQLQDTITIEQAAVDFAAAVAPVRRWPSGNPGGGEVLYRDLACRVQPQDSATVEERGLEGQEARYLIYLSRQLRLSNVRECRVLWTPQGQTAAQVLARLSYHEAEQIGALPILDAIAEV